jgi:hypothetical protein
VFSLECLIAEHELVIVAADVGDDKGHDVTRFDLHRIRIELERVQRVDLDHAIGIVGIRGSTEIHHRSIASVHPRRVAVTGPFVSPAAGREDERETDSDSGLAEPPGHRYP